MKYVGRTSALQVAANAAIRAAEIEATAFALFTKTSASGAPRRSPLRSLTISKPPVKIPLRAGPDPSPRQLSD